MNNRRSRISPDPYGEMPPIVTERRQKVKTRCEKTTRLATRFLSVAAGTGAIGAILCFSMPSIVDYLNDRDALHQAMSENLHNDYAARRDIVETVEKMAENDTFRSYGLSMAVHLQKLIDKDTSESEILDSWESLLREVACANHRFGAKGPMMYVTLREKTFDTEARQKMFDRARREIVREGDRDAMVRAEENLNSCP